VITPTAARGVLEAIFWRPEFRWVVTEVDVLHEVRWIAFVRNEVKSRASDRVARGWAQDGGIGGYVAADDRAQRHTLALRDVAYIIRAHQVLQSDVTDDPAKYRDQFRRRVADGRCFATPFLGCREFSASFAPPATDDSPIDADVDLGLMLGDIAYTESGRGTPRFFQAALERGTLRVPLPERMR
jgi:CRISPR-associated protein Cas5d